MAGKKRSSGTKNLIFGILTALFVSRAILDQLSLPPEERTWYGTLFGIPYDFRMPTVERIKNSFWNQESTQLLVPSAFGIGWTLNLYPLLHREASKSLV